MTRRRERSMESNEELSPVTKRMKTKCYDDDNHYRKDGRKHNHKIYEESSSGPDERLVSNINSRKKYKTNDSSKTKNRRDNIDREYEKNSSYTKIRGETSNEQYERDSSNKKYEKNRSSKHHKKESLDKKYERSERDFSEKSYETDISNHSHKRSNIDERYEKNTNQRRERDSSNKINKENLNRHEKNSSSSKKHNYHKDKVVQPKLIEHYESSETSSEDERNNSDLSTSKKRTKKCQNKHSKSKSSKTQDSLSIEHDYDARNQHSRSENADERFKNWSNANERRKKYMDLNARKDGRVQESSRDKDRISRNDVNSDLHSRISKDDVNIDLRSRISRNDINIDLRSNVETSPELAEETPLSKTKITAVNLRTGGAYIPPAKLKMLQEQITDKSSEEYQRLAWEALKKSLTGLTNKINLSNIREVVMEILKENVVRGRGVLTRAIIQAQDLSPTFTHVYAALVVIINSKFPNISELLLKRLLIQFKKGFRRNNKQMCISSTKFIAHLLNQQVTHELVVLEILMLLLEKPTDDSVEIAIAMLKECGKKLTQLCNKGMNAIFERLRHILHETDINPRVRYMVEVIYAVRKDKFKDFHDIPEGLDLIDEEDKYTHMMTLEEAVNDEAMLNVFKFDPEYIENEERYKEIRREIEDDDDSNEEGSSDDGSGSDEDEDNENEDGEKVVITDMTETNLVALRRNIYLTIQSSLDFEECAHKLLKMEFNPGQIVEMCYMILDCCAQQRTYEKFYGLLAQRFCQLNKIYVEPFTDIFKNSYETIHRLETNKLRNVAKFFAHLLYTDAISWMVLANIKLNEVNTTSSSRIFIKILFQDLSEFMGLGKLFNRVKDVTFQEAFDGLFPRDNPQNTRFAINFFTSIGLGGLTDELREHLKTMPKKQAVETTQEDESSSESDSSSSSSESSSSSSSSSSPESEDSDNRKGRRRKTFHEKEQKSSQRTKKKNRR